MENSWNRKQDHKRDNKIDFGMPVMLETPDLESCVKLCKQNNLDFIELNMNFPKCQISRMDSNELMNIKRDSGIYFTIHTDENMTISDFNPYVKAAYIKTMEETIAFAKEIQAPIINMHLSKGIYITLPDKKVYLFQEYKEEYLRSIREFRDFCDQKIGDSSLMICIENTDGFMPHEKEALELLLESKNFGLTFDTGHSHVVGDLDEIFYIKHLYKMIHMHLHDAKDHSNHLALGDGNIDISARLRMAQLQHARVVLETKTIQALQISLIFLQQRIY